MDNFYEEKLLKMSEQDREKLENAVSVLANTEIFNQQVDNLTSECFDLCVKNNYSKTEKSMSILTRLYHKLHQQIPRFV